MKKLMLGAAALALIAGVAAVSQTASVPKHKAVFQLTEAEGEPWDSLIGHITNLQAAFANDGGSQVEVVFFGPGLSMLLKTDTKYAEDLKKLADHGVKLAACQNSMKHRGVKTEDLLPFASQVDSGVAELTRRQEAGFAYIH